jgi:putative peptide zinc metalloprotease protein
MTSCAGAIPLVMRADILSSLQRWRGRIVYHLKDPVSLAYFQLGEEEHWVWTRLNGKTTRDDLRRAFSERFAPRRLSEAMLSDFLVRLFEQRLVLPLGPGQGELAAIRHRGSSWKSLARQWTNPLAIRLGSIDPGFLLRAIDPLARRVLKPWVLVPLFIVCGFVLGSMALDSAAVAAALPTSAQFFTVSNALTLAAVLAAVKVVHELAHAAVCRAFGGESHEMGIMLLGFIPCLYCNVSDAWMFPGKWQRAAVGAAGVAAELVLAAFAALGWRFTQPGVVHWLALDVLFVCSVCTLLFNANPFLRYDGYYVLADLAEIPNLHEQTRLALRDVFGRWILGLEPLHEKMLPARGRLGLACFGAASLAARLTVLATVLWFVYQALEPLGLGAVGSGLSVLVVSGCLLPPLWGSLKLVRGALKRKPARRMRAVAGLALASMLVAAALFFPFPYHVAAPVLFESEGARSVFVQQPGTLVESAREGERVVPGQVLARLEDHDRALQLARLEGWHRQAERRLNSLESRRLDDPSAADQIPVARERLADLELRLGQARAAQSLLVIRSPIQGTVLSSGQQLPTQDVPAPSGWTGRPLAPENLGCYLDAGTLLCVVGESQAATATLLSDQADMEFVRPGQRAAILPNQSPQNALWGTVVEVAIIEADELPGNLAAAGMLDGPSSQGGEDADGHAWYQARVRLDEPNSHVLHGAVGQGRVHVGALSWAARLYRALRRAFGFFV